MVYIYWLSRALIGIKKHIGKVVIKFTMSNSLFKCPFVLIFIISFNFCWCDVLYHIPIGTSCYVIDCVLIFVFFYCVFNFRTAGLVEVKYLPQYPRTFVVLIYTDPLVLLLCIRYCLSLLLCCIILEGQGVSKASSSVLVAYLTSHIMLFAPLFRK